MENYPTIEADSHEKFLVKLLQLEVERRALNMKMRVLEKFVAECFYLPNTPPSSTLLI